MSCVAFYIELTKKQNESSLLDYIWCMIDSVGGVVILKMRIITVVAV